MSVAERFERHAPASVMARTALEHAVPAGWPDARASSGVDEVFDAHRQRQYPRELLFSTVVELMTLVSLGLRPSLHAAAQTMETLPVTLAALYDKVNRTELAILRALVRGGAERLAPVAAAVDGGTTLPGWRLRVLDGNHLPASEKRLAPLRGHRGAALPGQALESIRKCRDSVCACGGNLLTRAVEVEVVIGLAGEGRVARLHPEPTRT